MANYMTEVAKMLGVELGEKFEIVGFNETYFLDNDGLYCFNGSYSKCNEKFSNLLSGCLTIKREPWKPKNEEFYYSVEADGCITRSKFCDTSEFGSCHKNYYKLGNCYRTREEAEANRDKWVKFYESDEVLEV